MLVYEVQSNGTYDIVQTLAPFAKTSIPQITEDGKNLVMMEDAYTVGIYKRIKGLYNKVQTISNAVMIGDLKITKSFKFIILFDYSRTLKIYENQGNFTLKQTLSIDPYFGYKLKATDETIILAGYTENILFFQNNGTHFALADILVTP